MMEYAVGQKDRPVMVERLTETKATSGAIKSTWTTLERVVWMSTEQVRQDENFKAGQVTAPPQTRWCLEYRPDMDPEIVNVVKERRLVYLEWIYEIVGASQIGFKDGIELMTSGRKRVPA